MKTRWFAGLLVSLFFLAGCAAVQGKVLPRNRARVQPYDARLEASSRSALLYSGFDRVISVSVTLMDPGYLGALEAELDRLRLLAKRETLGLEAPPEGGLDLLLFLDGRDPGWEDLEDRAATFQVELLQGERVSPVEFVRRLDEDDATVRHLFPLVNDFGRLYRLRSATPLLGGESIRVRIAGAPGELTVGF